MTMRNRWLPALLLIVTACAEARQAATPTPETPPGTAAARYQAIGTVLQNSDHGPELCLGAVADSLPPQCGGVPLAVWDWNVVSGERRSNDTIWGTYRVVGTFDGTTFTITEKPREPPFSRPDIPDSKPACPEPSGGWDRPEPKRMTIEDIDAAAVAVERQPDFSGLWLFDPEPTTTERQDHPSEHVVLNVAFTGDLGRHRTELRRYWGGALCVVRHERTLADLNRLMNQATAALKDRGLELLGFGPDQEQNIVHIDVVFADEEDEAAMDARFGKGTVKLTSAIRPVA